MPYNSPIGLYGARGHGRDVLQILESQICNPRENIYFIDDDEFLTSIHGYPVVTFQEMQRQHVKPQVVIAVSNGKVREQLSMRLGDLGVKILTLTDPSAIVSRHAQIGKGSIISPYSVVSAGVTIGDYFHCNTFSTVAHDCKIGNFVTFAPGVKCNGCVHIDDHAYLGSGAVIIQGNLKRPLKIGKGAVVGMGAIVIKDVEAGETVVGNPARRLEY